MRVTAILADDGVGTVAVFGLVLAGFVIYLIPAIIATLRGHKNATAITVLNLFLGWMLVGWVVALVWAVMAEQESRPTRLRNRRAGDDRPNPFDVPEPAPLPTVFHFACPHCRRAVQVAGGMLGMAVTCGSCHRQFTAAPTAPPA